MIKECTTCKESFPPSGFYLKKGKPRSQCKKCHCKSARPSAIKNKESCYARTIAWREKSREKIKTYMADRYNKNPDEYRNRTTLWRQKNPVKALEHRRTRLEMKLNANAAWADEDRMREIYQRAARISKCTGFKWHVDHVVPLQGKLVCGLHVPDNLCIITASMNFRKYNHWNPLES